MLLRQCRLVFWLASGLGLAGSSAQASFVFFTINPTNLNERALVGEQIFVVPGGFDYEFLVENIGTAGLLHPIRLVQSLRAHSGWRRRRPAHGGSFFWVRGRLLRK